MSCEGINSLVLPHYKRNSEYHSRRVKYEIPKDEQILFQIDENSLNTGSQTYSESHYANLMNITKKLPKNSIQEKEECEKNKIQKEEEKQQFKKEIKIEELNSKTIPIENVLKSQYFINKTLEKKPQEPKLGEIPKLQSKIGRYPFVKSSLLKYPEILKQDEEELFQTQQKDEKETFKKNFKSNVDIEEPLLNTNQQFQRNIENDFKKQKLNEKQKKPKKESLLKKRKKKNSFESFSFYDFLFKLKENFKNVFPFIFDLLKQIKETINKMEYQMGM
eukprot:gene5208-8820_t